MGCGSSGGEVCHRFEPEGDLGTTLVAPEESRESGTLLGLTCLVSGGWTPIQLSLTSGYVEH